jgi:anaerobic dimethyl sulfoxide reductase subunit A
MQELKDQVVTKYTTCRCNCGGTHSCILKAHVKNGKVIAVEPDDRFNIGVGREDEVLTDEDLIKVRLQRRPCVMGLAFHRYLYHPERILYPLKRAPGSRRGEGKYLRISWDEALATIAEKMKETRDKYGPLSIITPFAPNESLNRLLTFWGAGADSWGQCSWDAGRLMCHVMCGVPGWDYSHVTSSSAPDMLANTKLIVLWGFDPTVTHHGPAHQFAWYIKLARERGIPVIIIDPRYSTAARTLADQWIPIKPGTDMAMLLAIACVLFSENLWNKDFVSRFVEPEGFKKYQDYVLGLEDGIKKSPEWAEEICAVPAETIYDLARLIGKVKPAWLWAHWSVNRKSHGEQTVVAFVALQTIMGYWGIPGVGPHFHHGPARPLPYRISWGPPGPYKVPKLYRSHNWAQACLLLEKVRTGELSEKEYRRIVGWRANPDLVKSFNPKLLFWGGGEKPHASNHVVTACDSADDQVKAIYRMDFVVSMHSIMNATVRYADIILPAQDWMWEEKNLCQSHYGGFESVNYTPGVVDPPGEVKPWAWVYTKLAEKLGIDPKRYFKYYTNDQNWDADWEKSQKDVYSQIEDFYKKRGQIIAPWDEFIRGKFLNLDEMDDKPFTGWEEQIKEGKPFKTKSGKIELHSEYIADENNRAKSEHLDSFGRLYDNLPGDWGDMLPSLAYRPTTRGMDDPLVKKYPLMLLTPHSRYRVHYLFWEHNWLRNHVYRHRVWLNTTDARNRGLKDNDLVKVFNDRGTVVLPAYVTNRIMPGVVLIHQGGRYEPNKEGIDTGASPSTLLGGDSDSCVVPGKATNLVQIEKYTQT